MFHKGANEPKLLIEARSEFYAFQLEHSSICLPSVSRRSFAIQKQKEDYFLLVKENCLHDIENLLSKNISVEIKDKYGRTPSHYAAKCARLDIVNLFHQKGANFKDKDKNGETPLDFVSLFLKGSGKDISGSNKNWLKSWKPLHYAAYNNNVGIVEKIFELLLKESNNDINVRDGEYGYAPLNVAVYYDRTEMVKFLLDKNADIEAKDKYGYTPLHHAVRYSTLNMTRLLCEKDANIKAKNKEGEIPLCIADQYGKVDIIGFLLSRGATIEVSDFNDNTVLKLAYCIKGLMEKTNNNLLPSFKGLESKLPKSVKNLVFASKVCITNVYFNEYLYSGSDSASLSYSNQRRAAYTWVPSKKNNPPGSCGGDEQGMWKIQFYGDYACITNVYFNEYLYPGSDSASLSHSNQRRAAYTWVPSKKNNPPGSCGGDEQGMWKIQPHGDYVCITNVYFNEYLYAAAGSSALSYVNQRRVAPTWVPSKKNNPPGSCGGDKQGMWKIEDCGSTRNRRDTRELGNEANLDSNFLEVGKGESFNRVKNLAVNQGEHHYYHDHSSHQSPIVDSSNQPRIAASSGTRPSSWINDLCSWAKEKGGKLASGLVNGLYGDTTKELKDSKPAGIQIDSSDQLKSKHPSYDQAQEVEFQYMSKYNARKSNDKNVGAYSKKCGNDRQAKQQYGSKMGNEQSVNQSRVVGNERQQKLGVLHNGPKPTLSHHSNKNHSYFDGQPKKINERKEHIVNYKQCDNSSYKHSNQHKPMISANNKWSERISNERIDSRKMIGGANQKQQGFHQNQQSSHNSKHAHLTRATAQVDVPSTLFALNMLAMKATNQKSNNTPLPKKIQKGMLHAEKVRAETLGRKVGGRIEGTLWFTK
ncbi:ankyrin repeat domain-containing protein [Wolbachia endosymbiont (group A) of Philonthus cognatus]|uniref:ankyrin repeat domain-containing protein n=1 Tax=Wolbachia endosymbiont (group A) of Philonthus cognatus TaxID=2954046 RepID=UPI00222E4621|nr:ankyrin repeat domain-containing protein [Wolbachia endosymbiont (group A) of Philonthus cognatus]